MSIMGYNGGSILAVAGDECVCIATDLRIGEKMTTIATNVEKVYKLSDKLYIGICGLHSDTKTVLDKVIFQKNQYELRENRTMKPEVLTTMVSNLMYKHRFGNYFVEPVIAGLDPKTSKPYLCSMDVIGCVNSPKDFVATGTASEYLLCVCEGYWRPNMVPEALFEATAQAMLSAVERDASSGWGIVVYTITKDKVNVKVLKARLD